MVELKAKVLSQIPDAEESEFRTALRRLHIASFDETG